MNRTYSSENYDPDLEVEFSKEFNAVVLMNFGKSDVKIYDLTGSPSYSGIVPVIEYSGYEPFLVVYKPKLTNPWRKHTTEETKSKLTFKFDTFIEYKPELISYDIEKIEYTTNGCYGMCPIFDLEIDNDGNATLFAKDFNYTESWQKGKLLSGKYKLLYLQRNSVN